MLQASLYCVYSDIISVESLGVAYAAYEIYGPEDPLPISKDLLMFMIRSQRPLYLTAGKFVPMSLTTFVTVFIYI